MKIGIISDTHGYFDPRLPEVFAGVDHILHGGDIGPHHIILELEHIAPVTAVLGNNDFGLPFAETELLQLQGQTFLLQHIVDVDSPDPSFQRRLAAATPDVVIYGHTHQARESRVGPTLYVNPGYAGKPRFHQPRSVALLHGVGRRMSLEFKNL